MKCPEMFSYMTLLVGCVCSTEQSAALMDRDGDVMCTCGYQLVA